MPKSATSSPNSAPELTSAQRLPPEFFARDPREVGRDLLGKVLVRCEKGCVRAGRIVEAEAYLGTDDPAAHAAAGITPRNRVLFGPPGHAYVYFIYGTHFCLNVSCMPEGDAGCVLIRALEPLTGIVDMARARRVELGVAPSAAKLRLLASGPGRLAEAFGITRPRDNDKDMTSAASDLLLLDDGYRPKKVATTPRVGITKAAAQPLRYIITGNPFVSGKRIAY